MESSFWWQSTEEDGHERVFEYVKALEESQRNIHDLNIRNAQLYGNCDLVGVDWTVSRRTTPQRNIARVTENVVQSVIDTATSMIAKARPKATFQTDGADFSTQRRAKLLDKFVVGMFQKTNIYDKAATMFRDACIFGTGVLHVFEDSNEVCVERVLPDELLVDQLECVSTTPRQMHRRRFVSREVLKFHYPDFAERIDSAKKFGDDTYYTGSRGLDPNLCAVVESWHLPSSPDAGDGMHAICIEGATLYWEEYEKNHFPFVIERWSDPVVGFYGQGLAEQLSGIQLRINKLNRFIEKAQDLIAVPRIFMDLSSKGLRAQITNEIGAIIPYRGRPPIFMTPTAVGAEIYQYKERLKASAFEFAGISQLSAQSKKPAGLDSAVALREYSDIETQRFAIQAQRHEKMFLDIGRLMIETAKDIAEREGSYTSVFKARSYIQKIDWDEVSLDDDCYSMDIEASSILSRTPAGRLQSVIELAQSGLINTDEARRLLQHPDIERQMSLSNAGIEDIEATIEELLDGKFTPPETFQNLGMGITRVHQAYLKARRDGAPEDVLDGMRQWLEQADYELNGPPETRGMQPGAMPPMGAEQQQTAPPEAALSAQTQSLRPGGLPQ